MEKLSTLPEAISHQTNRTIMNIVLAICAAVQVGCASPSKLEGTHALTNPIIVNLQKNIEKTNLTRREIRSLIVSQLHAAGYVGTCDIRLATTDKEMQLIISVIICDKKDEYTISGIDSKWIEYLRKTSVDEIEFNLEMGLKSAIKKNPDITTIDLTTLINQLLFKGIFEDFNFQLLTWHIIGSDIEPYVTVMYRDNLTRKEKTFTVPIYNPNTQVGPEKIAVGRVE